MLKALASLSIIAMIMSLGFLDVHDGPCLLQPVPGDPGDDTAADAEDSSLPLLSQAFNRNKSTMHSHLKQLHDADLISIRQDGRSKRCFARDDVLSMIGKKSTE